jgi:hypothetical protein
MPAFIAVPETDHTRKTIAANAGEPQWVAGGCQVIFSLLFAPGTAQKISQFATSVFANVSSEPKTCMLLCHTLRQSKRVSGRLL